MKSASGDLSVREAGGGVNVQNASGDVDIEIVRGPDQRQLRLGRRDDRRGVRQRQRQHGRAATRITGRSCAGTVSAHAVSGDVSIAVRRGSKVFLDCNTVSGDTRSELELSGDVPAGDGPLVEVRAKTVSGDISITRAPAPSDSTQGVHA